MADALLPVLFLLLLLLPPPSPPFLSGTEIDTKKAPDAGAPYNVPASMDMDGSHRLEGQMAGKNGARTKWTFSAWARRLNNEGKNGFGDWRYIWVAACKNIDYAGFHPDGQFYCVTKSNNEIVSAARFTDPEGVRWNHFVCAFDSTQKNEADRMKMFVNGAQVAGKDLAQAKYPAQGYESEVGGCNTHRIGNDHVGASGFLGRMADLHLVHGTALPPSSFGQGATGAATWAPKLFAGPWGTRGYHLDFSDSKNLGTDKSPNGNHFTKKAISSTEAVQSNDVPGGGGGGEEGPGGGEGAPKGRRRQLRERNRHGELVAKRRLVPATRRRRMSAVARVERSPNAPEH